MLTSKLGDRTPDFGVRRADGQPWRTEAAGPTDHAYYAIDDEVTSDGMVFVCADLAELAAVTISQNVTREDLPQPGAVVPMRRRYEISVGFVLVDLSPQELMAELTRKIDSLSWSIRTLTEAGA